MGPQAGTSVATLCSWIVEATPQHPLPEWIRTALVDADGVVYVPTELVPRDAAAVTFSALYDRAPPVRHLGHAFVPAQWMRAAYPATAELLELIERRVREAMQEGPERLQGASEAFARGEHAAR